MEEERFFQEHWDDASGNPGGGISTGRGFTISWQNGPLGKIGTPERRDPNGAFVEHLVTAVKGRFQYYQDGNFPCAENQKCIQLLNEVLSVCRSRRNRTDAKTEGTHEGT